MLPSTGISSTLVGNELGISSHAWSTLCTSNKVNMWSRWKPIKWNTVKMTEEDFAEALYGIRAPKSVTNPADAPLYSYEYIKPTGESLSPYRIGDFRNYEHLALSLCYKLLNVKVYTVSASLITFYPNFTSGLPNGNMLLSDLTTALHYPALILPITEAGQTTIYYRTSEYLMGDAENNEIQITYKLDEPPFNGNRAFIGSAFWVLAEKPYLKGDPLPLLLQFTALPYNSSEDAFFDIDIERFSPVTFRALSLCNTATQSVGELITKYDGTGAWYNVNNEANLFVECEIRNDTATGIIFNATHFRMLATDTFANGYSGKPTGDVSVQLWVYKNGWQKTTSVDMPKGSRELIRLGIPGFLTHYKGIEYRPTIGERALVSIKIKYNGVNLTTISPINYRKTI